MMEEEDQSSSLDQFKAKVARSFQHYLDRSARYHLARWLVFLVCVVVFTTRVVVTGGWYIVTYGLGIFLLNNLIGFISPQIDPENEGPVLPTSNDDSDEFRPFTRRLPEFQFWYVSTKGVLIALCMTFFDIFDLPVFWPILLLYFIALFAMTMKRQIKHMMKHKYVPWDWGKAKGAKGGKVAK